MTARTVYFGFNDPRHHARGVEYVILTQAAACDRATYVFLGPNTDCFRWRNMVCISIKKNAAWPVALNAIMAELRSRYPGLVVHGHNYLMAAVLLSKVDLFTVHDGLAYLKRAMGSPSRVYATLERWVYRRSGVVHFISEYARSMAEPPSTPGTVIANTCPREVLPAQPHPAGSGIVGDYALIVRSIEARAGLDLLLEVAEAFRRQRPGFRFVVAGKGPLLDRYRNEVRQRALDNVDLLGYVDDARLEALYRGARVVVVPALYGEGFGLPVVEGYFFGRTVLASNVCAMPEVVCSPDFLFENNAASLGAKLGAVLDGRLALEPQACRDYYAQRFGLARYRRQFAALYREAAHAGTA
jgi:glycosyltransferase involved in cell wall biosynthesis